MSKRYYSKEEIAEAKNMDIMALLSKYDLIKKGNWYFFREHDSLCIFPGTNTWYWYSRGYGGNTIDFFMKYEGMTFLQAVDHILNGSERANRITHCSHIKVEEKAILSLPPRAKNNKRVIAYLNKTRGISYKWITYCLKAGSLYEVAGSHNAAFIGKDFEGNIKHVYLRGTGSKRFVQDMKGSDKKYGFRIECKNKDILHLFESPIDLLSYLTLLELKDKKVDDTYISLSSTSRLSAESYINNRAVKKIYVRTDNDNPGRHVCAVLKEKYPEIEIISAFPNLKDYNEDLLAFKSNKEFKL